MSPLIGDRLDRIGDRGDVLRFMSLDDGFCNHCRHVDDTGTKCKAFPRGIPSDILTGEVDHRTRVRGDKGITFMPRED